MWYGIKVSSGLDPKLTADADDLLHSTLRTLILAVGVVCFAIYVLANFTAWHTLVIQAWIVDEAGAEQAGEAFLRGSQTGQAGGLIAIPISIALGSVTVRLPILLVVFLALTMTGEGFTPTPSEDRTTWAMMLKTVQDARQMVRRQPLLLALLGIGLFYGL